MAFNSLWYPALFLLLTAIFAVYLALRRLVLHPLAYYPGPPAAAVTSLYKTYFEVVKGGQWLRQLDELHNVYGDVVRVGPNELHFKDYRIYDKIFSVNSHLTKDPWFYACFGVGQSTFGAIDPAHAKSCRELLSPFFDRRSMLEFETVIRSKIELLADRLSNENAAVDMFYAFRCATMDIIATLCFGRSSQLLQGEELKASLLVDIQDAVPLLWTTKHFPWVISIAPFLPGCIKVKSQFNSFLRICDFVFGEIHYAGQVDKPALDVPRFIYKDLPAISNVVHGSSSSTYLVHEALALIQAGSDTVANTCITGVFHVLSNPSIHRRLVDELQRAWPDARENIGWNDMEKIPYLTAVIKESLRLSHGFVSPLPRVVGKGGLDCLGYKIPPGTVVGMSTTFIHTNPELFPKPHEFCPERWIGSTTHNKYLLSFSRGTRMCLGINMAWAELYLFFGILFRKLDMEIVDTSARDVTEFDDYFVPVYTGRHLKLRIARKTI
ncbi:benzoate 4-monooxygenase cytochrome P450 [Coprinopsis marcescibilis]|uniref:Benzoate 4-monooxygenase cytochrome P450 n=1 Tax=Coprinopsis marcescibilis TaxID=230819 RepID=A0A5C3L930_COPMA|nr:benzoate 4-monooxygenase cytochrome P450 [Coprinopsis marcescibilis]